MVTKPANAHIEVTHIINIQLTVITKPTNAHIEVSHIINTQLTMITKTTNAHIEVSHIINTVFLLHAYNIKKALFIRVYLLVLLPYQISSMHSH